MNKSKYSHPSKFKGRQQPRKPMVGLYDLLRSDVMRGTVIRFKNGVTYTVGEGWLHDGRRKSTTEMRSVLRAMYWSAREKPGPKRTRR